MKPALVLAAAGLISAQSSVVSVFFPGADDQILLGSIITSVSSEILLARQQLLTWRKGFLEDNHGNPMPDRC